MTGIRVLALGLGVVVALAVPAQANAGPPDIERVVVGRDDEGRISFQIVYATPVVRIYEWTVQVAIDADRDASTGIDGLDYSLDATVDEPALLTAVDGEPVMTHPRELRYTSEPGGEFGFRTASSTFSIPASSIGDPRRFDFYVFVQNDMGELDEAPSHLFVSAGSSPWTYLRDAAPARGTAYPVETYRDGPDITLRERPGLVLLLAAAALVGVGALLGVIGWSGQRLLRRRRPGAPTD